MYRITQLYTRTRHGWIPASSFIVDLNTNNQSVRSYSGAFFGPVAERRQAEWESETWPTEQDVVAHGPRGTISVKQYHELEEQAYARRDVLWKEQTAARKETKQQRRKRMPWVLATAAGVSALLTWLFW